MSCLQEFGVVSYSLLLSLIEYKTLVLREDMEAAQQLLPSIPKVSFANSIFIFVCVMSVTDCKVPRSRVPLLHAGPTMFGNAILSLSIIS